MPRNKHETIESLPHLNEREVLKILWASYMFSQGNPLIQKAILSRINTYYPDKSEIDRQSIRNQFEDMILSEQTTTAESEHKLGLQHQHPRVSQESITDDLDNINEYLDKLLAPDQGLVDNFDPVGLYNDFWDRDHAYLVNQAGRKNRVREIGSENTLSDRYFSFGVHYLLRQNSYNHPAFKKLLEEVRQVDYTTLGPDELKVMCDVIAVYNQHHPTTPVDITI